MPIDWVVKLGGSLYRSERLPLWLRAMAGASAVVVPGGGPFADQVRLAQTRWRFGDETAHAMAILAMAQYGLMLAGLCPELRAAAGLPELRALAGAGQAAVWVPEPSGLAGIEVKASWEVTSDSLAAWLAGRLGARRLLLVKAAEISHARVEAARLAAQGLIDPAFPGMIEGASYEAWLCGPGRLSRLEEGLRRPEAWFARLVPGH